MDKLNVQVSQQLKSINWFEPSFSIAPGSTGILTAQDVRIENGFFLCQKAEVGLPVNASCSLPDRFFQAAGGSKFKVFSEATGCDGEIRKRVFVVDF